MMSHAQTIRTLSEEDRPREKFAKLGAASLTSAELLAILVGSGSSGENVVQLMQRLMTDCRGSLSTLSRMTEAELCRYRGIGPAKAITILAACELAKRRLSEREVAERLDSSEAIYRFLRGDMLSSPVEECRLLMLNHNLRLLGSKLISRGGITGTVVDVRLILKEALLCNATQIVLCHNHPSGNLNPSRQDDDLTRKVREAAATMDINLIDHLIVTDHGYYSYSDQGRL